VSHIGSNAMFVRGVTFGPDRLREINKADIDARIAQFVQLVNFDIELV